VIVKGSEEFLPKATCHITWQASLKARASVRYSIFISR